MTDRHTPTAALRPGDAVQVADYEFRVYADVATVPTISDEGVVKAVDLDLDVVHRFDGGVVIEDEDEFLRHRAAFAYPPHVVAAAQAECALLADEMRSGAAHFAEELAAAWRSRLRSLLAT